jgi:hypothetical protein
MDYSNLAKSAASLSSPESLYELALSESLSSFSLLSSLSLVTFLFGFGGSGMDRGCGGYVDRTGRHSPFTRCHPWPIGDSLYASDADVDCLSQANVE